MFMGPKPPLALGVLILSEKKNYNHKIWVHLKLAMVLILSEKKDHERWVHFNLAMGKKGHKKIIQVREKSLKQCQISYLSNIKILHCFQL